MPNDKNVEIEEKSLTGDGNPSIIDVDGELIPLHELIEAWQGDDYEPIKTDSARHFEQQFDNYLANHYDDLIDTVVQRTMSPEEKRNAGK